MKIPSGLLINILLLIYCNKESPQILIQPPKEFKIVIAKNGLKLRQEPILSSKKAILTIPYKEKVEIIKTVKSKSLSNSKLFENWSEVIFKDKMGFASDVFLLTEINFTRYEKVLKFLKVKIPNLENFKERFELHRDWNSSSLQIERHLESNKYLVFSFSPVKEQYTTCSYLYHLNCINIIYDKNLEEIIFHNLELDKINILGYLMEDKQEAFKMGSVNYLDEEIILFDAGVGEGGVCGDAYGINSHLYLKGILFFLKETGGTHCLDKNCNEKKGCKNSETYRKQFYTKDHSSKIKEYFERRKQKN